ncbi:hypothetical protein BN2476_230056 [Paraburkholderia piptadeniae]|uniref:Uncharacterized protein n=1 Tax=Paraburkholderia piptadeniae TaxID=1701573 RepID=A0A1N7RWR3_9BURK|nr:hypothetical protein BN2476_230056 [Paraburkholderia piptadeniae]
MPSNPDRLSGAALSTGKFSGADLDFRLRLTTLQFPNVLKRPRTAANARTWGDKALLQA